MNRRAFFSVATRVLSAAVVAPFTTAKEPIIRFHRLTLRERINARIHSNLGVARNPYLTSGDIESLDKAYRELYGRYIEGRWNG
jgi:hypothetical protein